MQMQIRCSRIALGQPFDEFATRRLRFALSRFGPAVCRVTVHVDDVNGHRGGPDKRCRIAVTLLRSGDVRVEDNDTDPYAAVARAADRVGQAVGRKLARMRDTVK